MKAVLKIGVCSIVLATLVVGLALLALRIKSLERQVARQDNTTRKVKKQLETLSAQVESLVKKDEKSQEENSPTGLVSAFIAAMAAKDYETAALCIDGPKPDAAEQVEAMFTRANVDMSGCPTITNLVEVDAGTATLAEIQGVEMSEGPPGYFRKVKVSLRCPKGEAFDGVVGVRRLGGRWKLRGPDADSLMIILGAGTQH